MTTTPDPLSELERFVLKAAAYEHPLERVEIATSELAALIAIAKTAQDLVPVPVQFHPPTKAIKPGWLAIPTEKVNALAAALDALTPEPATKETT